jgi:hypothetical protein
MSALNIKKPYVSSALLFLLGVLVVLMPQLRVVHQNLLFLIILFLRLTLYTLLPFVLFLFESIESLE